MEDIVIVSAVRTPVGKFGGTLAKTAATDLGAIVIKEALARAKVGLDQDVADRINFGVYPAGLDTESIALFGKAALDQGVISKEPDYDSLVIEPKE